MEKLRELGLTTLEERRHRADMALMNSIVSGRTDMEREVPCKLKEIKTSKGFKDAYAKHRGSDIV